MGRLIRTTWRDVDIPVETALLADVNPKTTVRPHCINKDVMFIDDLGLPVNFLSRIDLALVFERDVARQIQTMKGMVEAISEVGPEGDLGADPRVRELRLLVAYVRDRYPTVTVDDVSGLVNEKLTELLQRNAEKLAALHLASDFLTRGVKSILKLVAASARLNGRCAATKDDVSVALELFEEKMRFVTMIEPSFEHVSDWKHSPDAQEKRQQRIIEHFGGRTANISAIKALFPELNQKTVVRDLHAIMAEHLGDGAWRIPVGRVPQR
jgi:DNA replicative helicase MCM subunit Mcm2 (Cdc46/Mcm family)